MRASTGRELTGEDEALGAGDVDDETELSDEGAVEALTEDGGPLALTEEEGALDEPTEDEELLHDASGK